MASDKLGILAAAPLFSRFSLFRRTVVLDFKKDRHVSISGSPPAASNFVKPQSRREWILNALRRDLITGELAPGTSVRQEDMARKYGVSQAPVREAFKSLVAEGLLTYSPNREHRVPDPTWTDLAELNAVLDLLEKEALSRNTRAFPRMTPMSLEALKAAPSILEFSSSIIAAAEADVFSTSTFHTLDSFLDRYSNQRRQAVASLFQEPPLVKRDDLIALLEAMLSGDVHAAEERRSIYRMFSKLNGLDEKAVSA
jgi:DNA-binding GntR family transcriptional regulator